MALLALRSLCEVAPAPAVSTFRSFVGGVAEIYQLGHG